MKFNTPGAQGEHFASNSAGTPLPLPYPSSVHSAGLLPDYSSQKQQNEQNFPLVDIVRLWMAPYKGTVEIAAPVHLLNDNPKADGVRVAIQHNTQELWSTEIGPEDTTVKHPTGVAAVHVDAGDRLYFRVSSRDDGKSDAVAWAPVIKYVNLAASEDANGKDVGVFSASNDFILGGRGQSDPSSVVGATRPLDVRLPFTGKVEITGTLKKPQTSDDVHLELLRNGNVIETLPSSPHATAAMTLDLDLKDYQVNRYDTLALRVKADSPVDLSALDFVHPVKVTYLSAVDKAGNAVPDAGRFKVYLPYDMDIYSTALEVAPPSGFKPERPYIAGGTGKLYLNVSVSNYDGSVPLYLTVKRPHELLFKKDVNLIPNGASFEVLDAANNPVLVNKGDRLFFGLSARNPNVPMGLKVNIEVQAGGGGTSSAPVFYHAPWANNECTRPWRGWSYGTYLPHDITAATSPLPDFTANSMGICSVSFEKDDAAKAKDVNTVDQVKDRVAKLKSKVHHLMLLPFPGGRDCTPTEQTEGSCDLPQGVPLWGPSDRHVYLTSTSASSSRHGAQDISVPDAKTVAPGPAQAPARLGTSSDDTFSAGAGLSVSYSSGRSDGQVDYVDVNGDGFPDVVGAHIIQYTSAVGQLCAPGVPGCHFGKLAAGAESVRRSQNATYSVSLSGNPDGSHTNGKGRTGNSGQVQSRTGNTAGAQMTTVGISLSPSADLGTSTTKWDLEDVNGDGLPDQVIVGDQGQLIVHLNEGYGFESTPETLYQDAAGQSPINSANGRDLTINGALGVSGGFNGGIYGFGGGITGTKSWNGLLPVKIPPEMSTVTDALGLIKPQHAAETLLDVNGDGLLDRVVPEGNHFKVQINTGNGFADKAVDWKNVPVTGNGEQDVSQSSTLSISGGAYFTIGAGFVVYVIVNPGADYSASMQRPQVMVRDVNGDGYPDYLYSDDGKHIHASLNLVGKTNLLKSVSRPLGATISLDYQRSGNTVEHPQSRWVLSRVETNDGVADDSPPAGPAGADYQLTTYQYQNGRYDRSEREFYGYSSVVETEWDTRGFPGDQPLPTSDPQPTKYRVTTRSFANDNFFDRGLLLEEKVKGRVGQDTSSPMGLYSDTTNQYDLYDVKQKKVLTDPNQVAATPNAVFPRLKNTLRTVYEPGSSGSITTETDQDYDQYGNVTKLVDMGDPSTTGDDYTADISYTGSPGTTGGCLAPYIVGLARSITVLDAQGKIIRRRRADFNCSTGDMLILHQWIDGTHKAESTFSYDSYGNLATVQGPPNLHGNSYTLTFTYDLPTRSHVTGVSDGFGYSSSATYDLDFGLVQDSTDANGNTVQRKYDDFGRLQWIIGPYQTGTGHHTLDFFYRPASPVPFAVTNHFDGFRNPKDPIRTVLFTDGLKRVIQTKKDATVYQSGKPTDVMVVSGRVTFDQLGRTTAAWYPTTEPANSPTNYVFDPTPDAIQPTVTQYDAMNRVTKTTLPDNSATAHSFALGKDKLGALRLVTNTIDADGHLQVTFRDVRDQIRAIQEWNGAKPIWTQYDYDPLQQLTTVVDDHNNKTTVSYDLLGRRTAIDNPDTGRTTMTYDAASNLISKTTAKLAAEHESISYDYELNRLVHIDYQDNPDNNVDYTYGGQDRYGNGKNQVGRITEVHDASGTDDRAYGKLGEIVEETKTINSKTQGQSENSPEVWTTKYLYDTWGRLQQLEYPDGEVLTYKYDSGGLPRAVSGEKLGHTYPYVQELDYDKFGQRVHMLDGNGVPTDYAYRSDNRRLKTLKAGDFQDLRYQYDAIGNITELHNQVPMPKPNEMGGPVDQRFAYDTLYRLTSAQGDWRYSPNKTDKYTLAMEYDSIHNITSKHQTHVVVTPGGATIPQKKTQYDFSYDYASKHPHAPTKIGHKQYFYDASGNQLGWDDLTSGRQRTITWDEENRIQKIADNGRTTYFVYNDSGQRVIKRGAQGETAYVNQFWTVRNRSVATKHVFIGSTRIASKVIPGDAHIGDQKDNFSGVLGQWWLHRSQQGWQNGKNTQKNPHYTGNKMPDLLPEDNFVYFYHPDHLGSTSFATDHNGDLYEHVEYFPFGETWVDEHSNTQRLPYLFTSKELDEETGLYYFGARYYDPRTSVWESADPALGSLFDPHPTDRSSVIVPENLALYTYSWNNPLVYRDPDGRIPNSLGPWEISQACTARGGCTRPQRREEEKANRAESHGAAAGSATLILLAGGEKVVEFIEAAGHAANAAGHAAKAAGRALKKSKGVLGRLYRKLTGSKPAPKRRVHKVGPHPGAKGPHTSYKIDPKTGKVTGYTEFDAQGRPVKRFRGQGRPHGGVKPPVILEPKPQKGPGAPLKVPRKPRPDELPKGYN